MKYLTKTLLALLLIVGVVGIASCTCIKGEGEITTHPRNVGDFTKVVIEGSADVMIEQSDSHEIMISTHDNLHDYIETKIKGSTLIITTKEPVCYDRLDVSIKMKNLEGVKIEGSGNIKADGDFETEVFKAKISGSGDIKIKNIEVIELECQIDGSGSIKLRGKAEEAEYEINGSGDILTKELEANKVEIEINGSGNCLVWAKEDLRVEINGSGDVKYKGNPQNINIQQNGSGEASKID
jgi:hypothetical protein